MSLYPILPDIHPSCSSADISTTYVESRPPPLISIRAFKTNRHRNFIVDLVNLDRIRYLSCTTTIHSCSEPQRDHLARTSGASPLNGASASYGASTHHARHAHHAHTTPTHRDALRRSLAQQQRRRRRATRSSPGRHHQHDPRAAHMQHHLCGPRWRSWDSL